VAKDISIKLDDKSVQALKYNKNNLHKEALSAFRQGSMKVMTKIFEESQELVPVKTGALRDSGQLITNEVAGQNKEQVSIQYGNDIVDYAVYVHEELQNAHAAPTQAKYLETPMAQNENNLFAEIKSRIAQVLSSHGFGTKGGSGSISNDLTEPNDDFMDTTSSEMTGE